MILKHLLVYVDVKLGENVFNVHRECILEDNERYEYYEK